MLKGKHLFFILSVIISLSSCTTTRLLTSSVKANEVTDLQKFETLSYITLIEKANRGTHNDTLSNLSKAIFADVLSSFGNRIPLTGNIIVNDFQTRNRVRQEIEFLCITADKKKEISSLKLMPTLDSLLEQNQKRFGLITITSGLTRVKGNYGKQIAKGIGIGILSLGMVHVTPIKAHSTVYVMILDSKDNNIAFFRRSRLSDKEPLDEAILRKQVQRIFKGYFWPPN
ncbi:MAG: hypothetical protein KIT62_00465 [Cyclobacteriaceae bacterium]|nr:hypothetical protein [Cyclobacteriaceae bacterium]